MKPLTVVPGAVADCAGIVALARRHRRLFTDHPDPSAPPRPPGSDPFDPYRDSEYEDDDRYHVLPSDRMPDDLRAAIFAGAAPAGTRPGDYYVQVNRYDRGDYVLPHRDSLRQGLYMLTTSDKDGLNAQHDEATVVFVPDRAGTFVEHDPRAWHWVDPVAGEERFTLVTIPPLPHREDAARGGAG
ncbi:hypothetical protein Q8791_06295 [Nocardiopsis sp. CT-R113]|uniref:2OG-Fe(II) oxygenase n=1 Tax=Nocardiopsis codii TaxID=3065942 RepID=A0ABU7K3K6_9ACTN|nr:hypothetical protein [Nocardiopsis sp. CT-R113]MEE2036830.1 hypothetical protein [Nocardiopsis sp. CT-R113]